MGLLGNKMWERLGWIWIQVMDSTGNESSRRFVRKGVTRWGVSLWGGRQQEQTDATAIMEEDSAEWDSWPSPSSQQHSNPVQWISIASVHFSPVPPAQPSGWEPSWFPAIRPGPWEPLSMLLQNLLNWGSDPLTPQTPEEARKNPNPSAYTQGPLGLDPCPSPHSSGSSLPQPCWATCS